MPVFFTSLSDSCSSIFISLYSVLHSISPFSIPTIAARLPEQLRADWARGLQTIHSYIIHIFHIHPIRLPWVIELLNCLFPYHVMLMYSFSYQHITQTICPDICLYIFSCSFSPRFLLLTPLRASTSLLFSPLLHPLAPSFSFCLSHYMTGA